MGLLLSLIFRGAARYWTGNGFTVEITGPGSTKADRYHHAWKPERGFKPGPRPNRVISLTMSIIFRSAARYWSQRGLTVKITAPGDPKTEQVGQHVWAPQGSLGFRA